MWVLLLLDECNSITGNNVNCLFSLLRMIVRNECVLIPTIYQLGARSPLPPVRVAQ